jgi:hypothetical protein
MAKFDPRLIFDDDYYRIWAVILSKKFKGIVQTIKTKYKRLGMPIPKNGFSSYDAYREWLQVARNTTNSNLVPGKIVEDILSQFDLDPKYEKYRNQITSKIFFSKKVGDNHIHNEQQIRLILRQQDAESKKIWVQIYPWTRNKDYLQLWKTIKGVSRTLPNQNSNQKLKLEIKPNFAMKEIWVEIYPKTKRTDYLHLWKNIAKAQEHLPGYRGKEKFQNTFNRDFKVYELYLMTKRDISEKKRAFIHNSKSIIENMEDFYPIGYESIAEMFHDDSPEIFMFDDYVRSISSRFSLLLKNVKIL